MVNVLIVCYYVTTMNNSHYLSVNTAVINIYDYRKKRIVDCLVSPDDLPALLAVPVTWFACYARKSKVKMYACAKLWNPVDQTSTTILMHRIILGVTDPDLEVDHRDNDGLNNQRGNLRTCTHQENMRFRQPSKDWAAVDQRRGTAVEYRQERAIARQVAAEYGFTRTALYKIRTQPSIDSPAAIAYRAAIAAADVRSLGELRAAIPADGAKFGLFSSGRSG